jgi:hypothetical protein
MRKPLFKYNINHYFSVLPRTLTINHLVGILEEQYGITEDQFNADRFLSVQSNEEVPLERLMSYSQLLGVPYYKLLN